MGIVDDTIAELDSERERIWLTVPDEVKAMGEGIIPRRTGTHGQYLSTLIFAEGEARTLSDEVFWGLLEIGRKNQLDLDTVKLIIDQIVSYKADFFDFVGLPQAAGLVHRYVAAAKECRTQDEFMALTSSALSYVNRLHMWIDAVFPWGVTNGFKRKDAA